MKGFNAPMPSKRALIRERNEAFEFAGKVQDALISAVSQIHQLKQQNVELTKELEALKAGTP